MKVAHRKKPVVSKCQRCGKPFNRPYAFYTLCPKCQHSIPKCGCCHIVMGREYSFIEDFAREVGRFKICTSCDTEFRNKGFLHIAETQYLYSSGRVVIRSSPPARRRLA